VDKIVVPKVMELTAKAAEQKRGFESWMTTPVEKGSAGRKFGQVA